jgi:hypothetical protein
MSLEITTMSARTFAKLRSALLLSAWAPCTWLLQMVAKEYRYEKPAWRAARPLASAGKQGRKSRQREGRGRQDLGLHAVRSEPGQPQVRHKQEENPLHISIPQHGRNELLPMSISM